MGFPPLTGSLEVNSRRHPFHSVPPTEHTKGSRWLNHQPFVTALGGTSWKEKTVFPHH
jgi:hypothetical protein